MTKLNECNHYDQNSKLRYILHGSAAFGQLKLIEYEILRVYLSPIVETVRPNKAQKY